MGEDNKTDLSASHLQDFSRAELEDRLASIRFEILRIVKKMGRDYRSLMIQQAERERIETRLEEIGVNLGAAK